MTQRWTSDVIRDKLVTDNRWLFRAILAIYAGQTADERLKMDSVYDNRRGFNKPDARQMTGIALFLESGGELSPKTIEVCRTKMCKYAGQLAKLANAKAAQKENSVTVDKSQKFVKKEQS